MVHKCSVSGKVVSLFEQVHFFIGIDRRAQFVSVSGGVDDFKISVIDC